MVVRGAFTHLILLAVACLARNVVAQTQFEIAPYVGHYAPLSILGIGVNAGYPAGQVGSRDTVGHQSSATRGVRVTWWSPGHVGIEASFGYAPSSLWSRFWWLGCRTSPGLPVGVVNPPVECGDLLETPVYPAHVSTVSAKALLRVPLPWGRGRLHVGAGLGAVGHGGPAYHADTYNGPRTFLGVIASVGGVIKLVGPVGMRFDAEDFWYSAHLGPCTRTGPGYGGVCDAFGNAAGRTSGPQLQRDLVFTLGLALTAVSR